MAERPGFYEFFAGGGMARAGLGADWRCLFANDVDAKKGESYRANWGDAELRLADVHALAPADLPGGADLAWASFPCQDLSLAGAGAGLSGARSGAFWGFHALIRDLSAEGRAPALLALENVVGLLTARGGRDFADLVAALAGLGYRVGAAVIDAAHFTPQSRPRLFIVAARADLSLPADLVGESPAPEWTPPALARAVTQFDAATRAAWRWWRLPAPPRRNLTLAALVEEAPADVAWRAPHETERLMGMMAPLHRARVAAALASGERRVGALYRRMRRDEEGRRVQRAEARFDGLAGCLRTPAGGSSRQTLLIVENGVVRSRLISAREAARLMGLPDSYRLPAGYTDACHLVGDGVCVPAVRFLSEHLLLPLIGRARARAAA
ncbi:MAG: DNA cytosine methyltransferase [Methylobacteriaceae bacterium]|nr:DNA cytosine methyltransferase [Methylobacteriaceae bacterium]